MNALGEERRGLERRNGITLLLQHYMKRIES
jgi:hypothetical protein